VLSYLDCVIMFIVGGLFVNPRRHRNVYRAMLAAFLWGVGTAAAYLLITRVLIGPTELVARVAGVLW
jgi:hypothetical protein